MPILSANGSVNWGTSYGFETAFNLRKDNKRSRGLMFQEVYDIAVDRKQSRNLTQTINKYPIKF